MVAAVVVEEIIVLLIVLEVVVVVIAALFPSPSSSLSLKYNYEDVCSGEIYYNHMSHGIDRLSLDIIANNYHYNYH